MWAQILEQLLHILSQWIYWMVQLAQEDWFPYFSFAWLLVGVIYEVVQNMPSLRALHRLFSYPVIDAHCASPESETNPATYADSGSFVVLLYPREFLEQVACRLIGFFSFDTYRKIYGFLRAIPERIYPFSEANVQSTFLSILFAIFLALFAYGDTIAIANGLSALGLIRGELPEALLYYERAVAAASFFAIIVGFFVLIETFAYVPPSDETASSPKPVIDVRTPEMARLMRGLSFIVVIIGIWVAALLGVGRIQALGIWENNPVVNFLVQFGINVLTLVNGILAAALVFTDGIRGLRIILSLALWLVIGALALVALFMYLGIRVAAFGFDVAWRLVLMVLIVLFFIFFRPPMALWHLIYSPFKAALSLFGPGSNKAKSEPTIKANTEEKTRSEE